jgi:uncharacterized protein
MSIEYLPVGIACNLKCNYCYQDPMRDAHNITTKIDWSAAKAQLEKENYKFSVFGGEPLLAPIEHLEEVFQFGLERFGRNSIQTNGVLITDKHIEMFKKYKVGVGLSLDGPEEMNGARCDLVTTRLIHGNLSAMCQAGVIPSIIVTVNKYNIRRSMQTWFDYLESIGIRNINLHLLETEPGREELALSDQENILIFTEFYRYSKFSKMTFKPFQDIRRLLLQEELKDVTCIWNGCDPLTTDAVHGVSPNGTRTNCGRTNKDGVNWVKGDKPGFERYIVLHATPQRNGGCAGCRFFAFCKGQCPGTAIDNDWRNRTVHCRVWYELFGLVEADILKERRLPVSRDSKALKELEDKLLRVWNGASSLDAVEHGDAHGDSPHGDSPHGDAHGDTPHQDDHGDSGQGVDVVWLNHPRKLGIITNIEETE